MKVPLIAAGLISMLMYFPDTDLGILIQQYFAGIQAFVLLAVPMFIFAADIMSSGNTSRRLLDFVSSMIGHVRGGYAMTTSVACALFGSVSGSTQATIAAAGKPMRERMAEKGYKDSQSIPLIVNASDLALMVPPSIAMIIYGVVTGTSVGELFVAGITPALIILAMFLIYNYLEARKYNLVDQGRRESWREAGRYLRKAALPLGFPVLIIGGIYSGLFSPTEAAAVSVGYAFLIEVVIFKSVKISEIPKIAESTAIVTAAVFILVAAGQGLSWVLSYAQIPEQITDTIFGSDPSQLYVLFMIAVLFFVVCMFIDPLVVIFVLTPIIEPVAMDAGIDPVALGIIVTLQAAIGSATPPFGVDIFTAIAIFRRPYLEIVKGSLPYFLILGIASALLILFPNIILVYEFFVPTE